MGNSVSKVDCVNIDGVGLMTEVDDFTITRTSGAIELKWRLCDGTDVGGNNPDPEWNFKSAYQCVQNGWRIFMCNEQGELPSFRPLDSIKPTMMETEAEVNVWRMQVVEALNQLYQQKREQKRQAREAAAKAKEAAEIEARKDWISICYQNFDHRLLAKYNDGKSMHGYFKVVRKEDCHEFTIMECSLMHEDWQNSVRNHDVWRFPLEVEMGVKGTTFECVTPDKIHEFIMME